jgi:hypothetical protein
LNPRGENLGVRLREVKEGKYNAEIEQLISMDKENLMNTYHSRDIEPDYKDIESD